MAPLVDDKPELANSFRNPHAVDISPAGSGPEDTASDRGPDPATPLPNPPGLIKERRIKDDGRYIIFYWEEGTRPHV